MAGQAPLRALDRRNACNTIAEINTSVCTPSAPTEAQINGSEVVCFDAATNQATHKATKAAFASPTFQLLVMIPSTMESSTARTGDAANGSTIQGILCACASSDHDARAPIARRSAAARRFMRPND